MIQAIEHIAIAAADPGGLARWYCDTLGFDMIVASEESKTYFVRLPGGGMLEILPANDKTRPESANDDAGIRHLALTVDDFRATIDALTAKGVNFVGPAREIPNGPKLAFFTDPEDNLLHLVWRPKPL